VFILVCSLPDDAENEEEWGDVDEMLSTGSGGSGAAQQRAASNRQAKLMEVLGTIEDLQSEKRSSKREMGLRRLFRALTQYACGVEGMERVGDARLEIVQACRSSGLERGPAEQYAACRVLEALALILPSHYVEDDEDNSHAQQIQSMLRRVVMATGRAPLVRGAALRAMSLTAFVSGDEVIVEGLMDICEEVMATKWRGQEVPSALRATALDCWTLLSTAISSVYVSGKSDLHTGRGCLLLDPLLLGCLDSPHAELRAAAGECVVVIHEARAEVLQQEEEWNASEPWEGSEWEEAMDEMQQRMAELATESTKHMSKRAKKQQRATFRDFLGTISEQEEAPEETITLKGGALTLSLTTWGDLVRLNFIRHCLQGGFQMQLLTNPSLQELFGIDARALMGPNNGLSQLEKRLILSKTSEAAKAAHRDMTRKRRVRNNIKNHFLTADGEEI